jgi:hypothetical protein
MAGIAFGDNIRCECADGGDGYKIGFLIDRHCMRYLDGGTEQDTRYLWGELGHGGRRQEVKIRVSRGDCGLITVNDLIISST